LPILACPEEGVSEDDELSHDGEDGDLRLFSGFDEVVIGDLVIIRPRRLYRPARLQRGADGAVVEVVQLAAHRHALAQRRDR